MVNTAKIEAEVKAVVAETESVISTEIGTVIPAWRAIAAKWPTYDTLKKTVSIIFPLAILLGLYCATDNIGNVMGLAMGRAITGRFEHKIVPAMDARVAKEISSQLAPMQTQIDALKADLQMEDAKLEAVKAGLASHDKAPITTGSIPKKAHVRKPARKPASSSSWFNLP